MSGRLRREPSGQEAALHPFLDEDPPIAFAHRGGGHLGVENSMAAFADAVALGYRYLETDVQATADGVLVAFHDDTLERATDGTGRISALPWHVVSRARIAGLEPIPRLEEVLWSWPEIRVNLDIKAPNALDALVRLLRQGDLLERVCVGSFSDERLRRVRQALGSELCTSTGPREVRILRIGSYLGALGRLPPVRADCVQVPPTYNGRVIVDRRLVRHCHARDLPVHVWTVNEPEQMQELLDVGVDGLMTDATRELRALLRTRGRWPA